MFLCLLISGCSTRDYASYYSTSGGNADGPPVTRSQVILTADKYARLPWFMAEVNRKGKGCGKGFKSDYPVGPRIGMGYKFGGWDTLDDFLSKIAQGYGTGTGGPITYEHYPFDCVTGISCTGLVSRAWHLDHKYTLTYPGQSDVPRQFHEITQLIDNADLSSRRTSNLKKGDAFINRSHMILYIYESRDKNPMVLHATVKGVIFEKKSWYYLRYKGYIPIRYNNIRDDQNPVGTAYNPIVIDSDRFPYTHNGNTRNVVSMEFDRYATAPNINQEGPETIYQIQLKSSGTVSVQIITEFKEEGIDNDIHLLSSLEKGPESEARDCIVGADRQIEAKLKAGNYYIVVDSGKDLPGEYRLSVNWADK